MEAAMTALEAARTILATDAGGMKLYQNLPGCVAAQLGVKGAPKLYYTHPGGNTPQFLVNRFAEKIAMGEHKAVLLAGAEALYSFRKALMSGQWRMARPKGDDDGDDDDERGVIPWGDGEAGERPLAPLTGVLGDSEVTYTTSR